MQCKRSRMQRKRSISVWGAWLPVSVGGTRWLPSSSRRVTAERLKASGTEPRSETTQAAGLSGENSGFIHVFWTITDFNHTLLLFFFGTRSFQRLNIPSSRTSRGKKVQFSM